MRVLTVLLGIIVLMAIIALITAAIVISAGSLLAIIIPIVSVTLQGAFAISIMVFIYSALVYIFSS